MAEPLRKPELQPERQFNLHRYSGTRSGGLKWWFWLVMAGLVGLLIYWLQLPRTPVTNAAPTMAPVAVPAAKPALDVAVLLSNPRQYAGKSANLPDVLVQSANGNASIFVGPGAKRQLLVILKKGAVPNTLQGKPRTLPQGGVVTISGTAQAPRPVPDLEKTAKISRAQAEIVSKQGIVIEADRAIPQTM
jgi:hypothetical protein